MVKAKRDKAPKDTRKPKHSGDANRANKQSKNGLRDASTARGGCHGGAACGSGTCGVGCGRTHT